MTASPLPPNLNAGGVTTTATSTVVDSDSTFTENYSDTVTEKLNSESISRMRRALSAFSRGEFVLVMDSADRENECDLIIAAEKCTVKQMAFMIRESTGIICLTTDKARLEGFGLHPATGKNTDPNGTNFYVSTDFLEGTTTGCSAADRLKTLQAFCNREHPPEKFSKPGHMFPLCANPEGVLARAGHTESTFDFCRLAKGIKHPVGALAELMHADGTMYREGDSRGFAKKHGLEMVYVSDIQEYRLANLSESEENYKVLESGRGRVNLPISECPVVSSESPSLTLLNSNSLKSLSEKNLSESGPNSDSSSAKVFLRRVGSECRVSVIGPTGFETVFCIKGDVRGKDHVPVRLHSECFTGDTLSSVLCDCGTQLESFMDGAMRVSDCAVLVYLKGHEGRGIGLKNKMKAYELQQSKGLDTLEANTALNLPVDSRTYEEALDYLQRELGIRSLKLHTNNPEKIKRAKERWGGSGVEVVAAPARCVSEWNLKYLETKRDKQGHETIFG